MRQSLSSSARLSERRASSSPVSPSLCQSHPLSFWGRSLIWKRLIYCAYLLASSEPDASPGTRIASARSVASLATIPWRSAWPAACLREGNIRPAALLDEMHTWRVAFEQSDRRREMDGESRAIQMCFRVALPCVERGAARTMGHLRRFCRSELFCCRCGGDIGQMAAAHRSVAQPRARTIEWRGRREC